VSKTVHQNHFHPVRDLPVMNRPVTLMVNRRQFKCHVCGKPFSETLDFVDKRRRFTNRFENQVAWSLINSDISNTAKMFDLSNDEVFSILKHVGDRDIAVFLRMRDSPSATLRARGLSVAEARISPICKPLY
jgi:transposase